ncbi:transcriptional regulator [Alphaproteobacteria bacterium AO1-B]|nr:transcriptional regulator [Alphaproteobacteria bacterium AO1-B]
MATTKQVPKDDWDQHSIKAELHRRGMTLAQLARSKGRTPSAFSHVWKRHTAPAEQAIAEFLGIPKEVLFKDRYPKRTAKILSSKHEGQRARQKATAAPDRKAA